MPFGDAIATCFRKYADFTGRASRPEFWWFALFVFVVQLLLFGAAGPSIANADPGETPSVVIVVLVAGLALVLPYLAAMVRRLHDTDRSGGFVFVGLIPLIGGIILIVLLASEGTMGPNRYGAAPEPHRSGS
jgi:uncharacterized membrane protein YhaH (DUF805 family)